jgi:DNA-binding GntR family transcriptional regulator
LGCSGRLSQAVTSIDSGIFMDGLPRLGTGRTLGEAVYTAIRQRLMAGGQEPGTFIREAELATAMGISRTPIREALGRLVSEGLVERIPHRGFRIPERSVGDLFHLYPILQALEVLAAELAIPRLKPDDLAEWEEINQAFAEAIGQHDVLGAVELNDSFHKWLSDRSGNPQLQELLEDLRAHVRRIEVWDFTVGVRNSVDSEGQRWVREHAAIIDAARGGELAKACRILRRNRSITYTRQQVDAGQSGAAGWKRSTAGVSP